MKPCSYPFLSLVLAAFPCLAAPPDAPAELRVNDVAGPVGTGGDVWFGWQVRDPDANEIQTRYQILVASDDGLSSGSADVWDSGEVESRLQNHVPFAGRELEADRRYHWKVRTWDRDGNVGPWSEPAVFTVGPLSNEDWEGAMWIRRERTEEDEYAYYRKGLELPESGIERATIYVSATHKYELHVNGSEVGAGPAFHHPQYQYYNGWDVTPMLRAGGENQLAVFHHWFGGGQGRPAGEPGVILKLVVHHEDGTTTVAGTDESWLQSRATGWVVEDLVHRNRGEGVGYVERIDARERIEGWAEADFDDSSWKPAKVLGGQPTEPWTGTLAPDLTRIEERVIEPAAIRELDGGGWMVDFGLTWAGVPRVEFEGGEAGTLVRMRGADQLGESGTIPRGTKSQSTTMEFEAVLDGEAFVYEPAEYIGMRYLQIDNPPMPVTEGNVSFVARYHEMDEEASSFDSPDATLNEVWALMKHALYTCAQEEFVDTPTREKGGFLGDAAIQSRVAMPVFGERTLTRRVLGEFLQSMDQHWSAPRDRGRMNAVYPNRDGGRDIPDFTQAYLPWVWSYYLETGDRSFLEQEYGKFADIADYVRRHIDGETGLVTRLTGGSGPYEFGIVDWPAVMRYGYDMDTSARTVINAWAYADFRVMERIAEVLGKSGDVERYAGLAEGIREAINGKLLGDDGVYIDGLRANGEPSEHVSQHANMFPLALGIVPGEQRASVIEAIKERRMSVGMVTVLWLVDALGEAGEGEHLIELFTNEEWDGWARSLARGAGATWESWDADTTGQSLSHAWGAAGLEGYVRHILGIRPVKPQYEEVRIEPLDFGESLPWAKGTIPTDRGPISVHWKRDGDSYSLELELPVNVTASVALPSRGTTDAELLLDGKPVEAEARDGRLLVQGVGSGKHEIVLRDAQ